MSKQKRKAIIDDGMNPELVQDADFEGIFQIPKIAPPKHILISEQITPFSICHRDANYSSNAVGFYEMDVNFSEILINADECFERIRPFAAMITPDCSLYRNAPLAVQIANVYRNRAVGYRAQRRGLYVITQVRWGTPETYTTSVFPEKIAFLGAPKKSIVAIGTYGCIDSREDKYYFKSGLDAMLIELEPTDVLVYDSMPKSVFGDYLQYTRFHQYDDWTTFKKGGKH
jgi:hypothetical protein